MLTFLPYSRTSSFQYLLLVLLLSATLYSYNAEMITTQRRSLLAHDAVNLEDTKDNDIKDPPKTGSFANCTSNPNESSNYKDQIYHSHPDSSFITISCLPIHYRIPHQSIQNLLNPKEDSIIIGVLSGASVPSRRTSIRSTWAYRRNNVFFIVAGPWEDIRLEYERYGDLLWIDKEEIYVTETSVLTLKTESFLSIFYKRVIEPSFSSTSTTTTTSTSSVKYLFKTDDDSYVHLDRLYHILIRQKDLPPKSTTSSSTYMDYWGTCNYGGKKPHRNQHIPWQKKWYISYQTYPEPEYPPYCYGAGYALSQDFLKCAVGQEHMANIRYMPNEDVAIGMLAERCGVDVTHDDRVWIRYDDHDDEEDDSDDYVSMDYKVVQHYVKSDHEMRLHHLSATGVLGPYISEE